MGSWSALRGKGCWLCRSASSDRRRSARSWESRLERTTSDTRQQDRRTGHREPLPPLPHLPRLRPGIAPRILDLLPTDVVNAADRRTASERAVRSAAVVVVEPVWQRPAPALRVSGRRGRTPTLWPSSDGSVPPSRSYAGGTASSSGDGCHGVRGARGRRARVCRPRHCRSLLASRRSHGRRRRRARARGSRRRLFARSSEWISA